MAPAPRSDNVLAWRRAAAALAAAVFVMCLWSCLAISPAVLVSPAFADSGKGGDGDGGGGGDDGGGDDGGSNSGSGSSNSGHGSADDGDDDDDDDGEDAGDDGKAGNVDHSGRDYIPDEIVVANLTTQTRSGVRDLGFTVLDEQPFAALGLTVTRLRVPQRMTAPSARTLLASRYPDLLVDLNALYRPQGQAVLPAPDYASRLIGWGHVRRDCGAGLRIGVLDTAVDGRVAALKTARIIQKSFLPAGVGAAGHEHGTAIAAILVGQRDAGGQGLLPGAELAVAEVFAADASGEPAADVLALVGGFNWLVELRVPIVNLSLAGDANALVALALQRVLAGQAVVVAAAGNGGPEAPPPFPAMEPNVIAVTAVDSKRERYAEANQGDFVDFAAPGVRIWTPGADPTGRYNTGTSFAVPYVVAAVAALVESGRPASAQAIVKALAESAIDLGTPGKDPVFGRGLIQAANPCSSQTQ